MPHSSQFPEAEAPIDRFQIYRSLLLPLASILQGKKHHPEGDVLYHLLQCYVLAADEFPYDEEIQLAALLRDVSKGLDANDHVRSGLEALEGHITARTAWLIEHQMEAHQIRDRTIGFRALQCLKGSPDYETLSYLLRTPNKTSVAALCREWSRCKEERRGDTCRRGVMTQQSGRYRRNPPRRLRLRFRRRRSSSMGWPVSSTLLA